MTQLAIVYRTVPHGNSKGREALDLTLLAASYEVETAVFFIADGIYQLLKNQQPGVIDSKDHIATYRALPMYDVEQIYICAESMQQRDIELTDLIIPAQPLEPEQLRQQLFQSKQVLTF
ncbi:sulfurtransferase complex subunit TusC [Ferrimonas pelagia]|uniref:Sulfurtransferase complex subunit TusC n=1 Tax=Ferrimonas pelagia TaxID=1177826 RepID=A0ABP9FJ46_9GAMM